MTEQYLHYLWRNRMIPLHLIKSDSGEMVRVEDYGIWNRYGSGPDFLHARVRIGKLLWCGHVEIHLKSSDWYAHKHHLDVAYSNVILHVVCDSDAEVMQDTFKLPEIAIRSVIDAGHANHFLKHVSFQPKLLCKHQLKSIPIVWFEREFERTIKKRVVRKLDRVRDDTKSTDHNEFLYRLIAVAIGGKLNSEPFLELAKRFPFHLLRTIHLNEIDLLIRNASGLFSVNSVDVVHDHLINNLTTSVPKSAWSTKGMFPASAPKSRVSVLISWIKILIYEFDITPKLLTFRKWKKKISAAFSAIGSRISNHQLHLIYINAFVPWFAFHIQQQGMKGTLKELFDELYMLPPDKNHIIQLWVEAGISPNNALESQAMMEIFNDLCANKRCLKCAFGSFLLR